jgi:phage terminase small subunit
MALNDKQRRFVEEYLVDLNATQAAIRAGYSQKTAASVGHENLRKPEIQSAIAEGQRLRSERTGITADRVVQELAKIGFADIRKVVNWRSNVTEVGLSDPDTDEPVLRSFNEVTLTASTDIDDDTAGAISEVSQTKDGALKIKMHDKQAALVNLGRHLGIFEDKVKVSGINVIIDPADERV